jgi:hypothetical protein
VVLLPSPRSVDKVAPSDALGGQRPDVSTPVKISRASELRLFSTSGMGVIAMYGARFRRTIDGGGRGAPAWSMAACGLAGSRVVDMDMDMDIVDCLAVTASLREGV